MTESELSSLQGQGAGEEMLQHFLRNLTRFCYRGDDKSLARPTSLFILFDVENMFDASLVLYI